MNERFFRIVRIKRGTGIAWLTCLFILTEAFFLGSCDSGEKAPDYDFAEVTRGSVEKTVSSTGTLNPLATVKVLARMNGKVEKIYVDYNSEVKQGDILAELNTDMLRLQREQQYASVIKARANYDLQLINYQNQEKLAEKNLISEYDLKTSKTNLGSYAADLAASEASYKVIETEINQYAYITSPIDGIVLERNINAGDSVVEGSNTNSTSIFTIAENLTEMQIEAWIGELDVSYIRTGQPVRFTLESLPGRSFTGEVDSFRLVPEVQNSVVSYKVIINVENRDGSLLPGMTCAVDFIVERSEDVLVVPNAALRYQPSALSAEEISDLIFNASLKNMNEEERKAALEAREAAKNAAAQNQAPQGAGIAGLVGGAPGRGRMRGGPRGRGGNQENSDTDSVQRTPFTIKYIWYQNDEGKPEPLEVEAGISDGMLTEILAAEGTEGMRIIMREKII